MTRENQLALIVAFYLSKFDRRALAELGYQTFIAAFNDIGLRLGVNRNTIKNMRDDFDPLHENPRRGWYQRPLDEKPTRVRAAEMLADLSFDSFTIFVRDLLQNVAYRESEEVSQIVTSSQMAIGSKSAPRPFVPRGATGRKAEELFIQLCNKGELPVQGEVTDRRDDGCGYDFLVKGAVGHYYIEVKGMAGDSGGLLLTDKEWVTAQNIKNYHLFIAYNLSSFAQWAWISDLTQLQPARQVTTVVQISWRVPENQIQPLLKLSQS